MIITVVIPCYNVSKHIEQVIQHLPNEVSNIIVVDDCSTDDTDCVLKRIQDKCSKVIYIRHEKNQGVGGAMITGFLKSLELDSDITIKLDGDDQMDSSYIPKLIQPIREGKADFTKGNRFRDFRALRKMPVLRRVGNLGLSFFIKAASGYWNIFDPANGFIAISKETLQSIDFNKIHKRYFFESSMLIEMYYSNTVIIDVPMKAKYGNEISNLSITRTLFEFPPKLIIAFIRRIILKYYLFDFNIASLYTFFGTVFFFSGTIYGIVSFFKYQHLKMGAPTGTVVIPTLLITLGVQLLLSAISFDISNFPKKNHSS